MRYMGKQTPKVGSYYEFTWKEDHKIVFAVLYGFERGKNKDIYTVMMYTEKKNFEYPITEQLFSTWVQEGRVREITSDEALAHIL
jgi:hypothetical protein